MAFVRIASSAYGGDRFSAAMSAGQVEIRFHHPDPAHHYTTSESMRGDVVLCPLHDVGFDSLYIAFVGRTEVRMEKVHFMSQASHVFLRITMPPQTPVPQSPSVTSHQPDSAQACRLLRAGQSYTWPFHFVVPLQLTETACRHEVDFGLVYAHHLLPPPSMGGSCRKRHDDLAPKMCCVSYYIEAALRIKQGSARSMTLETRKDVFVTPVFAPQPPLHVTPYDGLYAMRKTLTLRKVLRMGNMGKILAEGIQSLAIVIRPDGSAASTTPVARVKLRFEAPTQALSVPLPPRITAISGKIIAHTYYSTGSIPNFPDRGPCNKLFSSQTSRLYSHRVALGRPIDVQDVSWAPLLAEPRIIRRDSGYASTIGSALDHPPSTDWDLVQPHSSPSFEHDGAREQIGWQTMVDYPITLPARQKHFVPTFHSCLTSRVYALRLSIAVAAMCATGKHRESTHASAGSVRKVKLTLPLEIVAEHNDTPSPSKSDGHSRCDEANAKLPSFGPAIGQGEEVSVHDSPSPSSPHPIRRGDDDIPPAEMNLAESAYMSIVSTTQRRQ